MKRLPVDQQVEIRVPARVAFELRYILPLLSEALVPAERESEGGPSTIAMIDQVTAAIHEALPGELRTLVDERKIAEYRMNGIDAQVAAGVRGSPADRLNKAAGEIDD